MKKKNYKACCVAVFLVACSMSFGQTVAEKDLLKIDPYECVITQPLTTEGNLTRIDQIGKQNTVQLIQSQLYPHQQNLMFLYQQGRLNMAKINVDGSATEMSLYQNGIRNEFSLDMRGRDSDLSFTQLGNYNEIKQKYGFLYDSELTIIQEGNYNEFEQKLNNPTSIGMTIKQIGSGISMKIINN